jgi:putative ABC transport system permease protein
MLSNYLKMTIRSISKHKGYTFLNLLGLAIGMACCILILLFVQDELSFDQYHLKKDRIHRLVIEGEVAGTLSSLALAPFAAPPAFKDEIPEVESFVRMLRLGRQQPIGYQEKTYEERGIFLADETFFQIFSYEFLAGDPDTALDDPGSVVITEEVALRIFGDEDPIGKILEFTPVKNIHVKGVIKDVPRNSHFRFNYMISFKSLTDRQMQGLEQWLSISGWGYLLLQEGADPAAVQAKFPEIVEKNTGEDARKFGISLNYFLQKLTDIHLRSNRQGEIEANGNITYVYVFSAIALFILLIACINFMNLSTARSANRAREVGLRKVFGAQRKNLIGQFLAESIVLALTGLILAVLLAVLALPVFNTFAGKEMSAAVLIKGVMVAGMLFLIVFTGLLAGSYPAFFLSGFQPVAVFRGVLSKGSRGSLLRKILVVFQFTISIALIAGTGVVLDQIDFLKNKDLGFDKDQMMVTLVQMPTTRKNFKAVKAELLQNPNIRHVSFSSGVPTRGGELRLMIPEGKADTETFDMIVMRGDFDFIETYGIEIIAGRNYSQEFSTDASAAYIINETAARKFGWSPEEAVDKKLRFAEGRPGQIIGVVKDFHFQSLSEAIDPITIIIDEQNLAFASLKLNTQDESDIIAYVKDKWESVEQGREFDYFFIDEEFRALYSSEERLSDILSFFALLAIFVACLGLFGLASFTAEQRTKEIGIRKVLGANVQNIVFHLSKEFVRWVVFANLIAWPTAYFVMRSYWLADFPYRIDPRVLTFILAGIISLLIAVLTVSFQVVRAAVSNPIDSLRYE